MNKRCTTCVITVITLAVLFGSCLVDHTASEAGPDTIKLYGKIQTIDGEPISNSYIQVSDEKYVKLNATHSNKTGDYSLLVPRQNLYKVWAGAYSSTWKSMFSYIPETKEVTPGQTSELKVDFSLNPGANIILKAYDESGNLIRYKQFTELTKSQIFVTKLSNEGCPCSVCVIQDEYSNWDWNYAIPAIIVSPGVPNRIRLPWEIPGFGKVIVNLDNEGKGYTLNEQGGTLTLNLNYEAAKSKLSALQKDYTCFSEEGYEIPSTVTGYMQLSQDYLDEATNYLNGFLPSEMKQAVQKLNLSMRYASWAHEQLYLYKASADINKYRKGNLKINIVGSNSAQPSNYTIQLEQTSTAVHFGANPMGPSGGYDNRYTTSMQDMGVNYANITSRWALIEPAPGIFNFDNIDSFQNIDGLLADGFKLTGSLSLWLYCGSMAGSDFCPAYQYNMNFQELKQNVYGHMFALASRYKGKIDIWEINEINLPYANALDLSINQRVELCDVFARAVKQANPQAKILVSSMPSPYDFNIAQVENPADKLNYVPFPDFLNMLIQKQIPVDVIGLEFYYAGVNTEGNPSVSLDLVGISDIFDQYTSFDRPILVSEFSAPSVQAPGSAWWHSTWDQPTQADFAQEFYSIAFSKPEVQGITWSWGVSDNDAYIVGGGLLDADLKPKLSYYIVRSLVDSWSKAKYTFTTSDGELEFSGFGGDYEVLVSANDGSTIHTKIHLTEQKNNTVTLTF
jgi:endo-1,4-beta-xylanase